MNEKSNSQRKILIIVIISLAILACSICSCIGVFWNPISDFFSKKTNKESHDTEEEPTSFQDSEIENQQKENSSNCTPEKAGVSEKDFQMLINTYTDPFIIHIKTALDNYLSGSNEGLGALVKEGIDLEDMKDGLDNFDKSYYKSKFSVYWVDNNAIGGGKDISIIFLDKPDRMFTVNVYDLVGEDRYELRSFRDAGFSEDEMLEITNEISCFLEDERFSM